MDCLDWVCKRVTFLVRASTAPKGPQNRWLTAALRTSSLPHEMRDGSMHQTRHVVCMHRTMCDIAKSERAEVPLQGSSRVPLSLTIQYNTILDDFVFVCGLLYKKRR